MKYSVIIPTWNHFEDALKPLLESIRRYTTNRHDIEFIIVANGCTDGTLDYLDKLDPKKYKTIILAEPVGYPKAINAGLKVATGNYIILLNNDCVLLSQKPDDWLKILKAPFNRDKKVGISAPMLGYSGPADAMFAIFFCVMIKKEVFDAIGYLDETFTPGGGEDTDFCIKAVKAGFKMEQVPSAELTYAGGMGVGAYPIYHKGEATVHDLPEWQEVFDRNSAILAERYNEKWKLSNHCERAVFGFGDTVFPRETTRYAWAAEKMKNYIQSFVQHHGEDPCLQVVEFGCSSGYGLQFFHDMISTYEGFDYDADILKYADEQFGTVYDCETAFTHVDIAKWYELDKFADLEADVIIAFEFLEHLDKGREIAQELKKHCKLLLCTAPYKEPPGFWGPHHKLHQLTENDFPNFRYKFMSESGQMGDRPWEEGAKINLLMFAWELGMEDKVEYKPAEPAQNKILAYIVTRDRYNTTLPMAIAAIATQAYKPKHFILIDDGECKDLRETETYQMLFRLLEVNGITWEVVCTRGMGQHHGHEWANNYAKDNGYEWCWRVDDDEIPASTVLLALMALARPEVGAIGGPVPQLTSVLPTITLKDENMYHELYNTKIADIDNLPNIQWVSGEFVVETEHLHSTFLYRPGIAHYDLRLSQVAHREETMFSHEIFRAGYKLLAIGYPSATTWHLRAPTGGIRTHADEKLWAHDETIFKGWKAALKDRNKTVADDSLWFVLDNGLGDHYAFASVFEDILTAIGVPMSDEKLTVACCYPEIFVPMHVNIKSIADANEHFGDIGMFNFNIYGWMDTNKWKGTLADAFKQLYIELYKGKKNNRKPVQPPTKKRPTKSKKLPVVEGHNGTNARRRSGSVPNRSKRRK